MSNWSNAVNFYGLNGDDIIEDTDNELDDAELPDDEDDLDEDTDDSDDADSPSADDLDDER